MFPPVACVLPAVDQSYRAGGRFPRRSYGEEIYFGNRLSHCQCISTSYLDLTVERGFQNWIPTRTENLRQGNPSGWIEAAAMVLTVPVSPPQRRIFPFLDTAAWLSEWTPEVTAFIDGGHYGVPAGGLSKEPPQRTTWDTNTKAFDGSWWLATTLGTNSEVPFALRAPTRQGYTTPASEPLNLASPYLLWYVALNGTPMHDLLPKAFANKKTAEQSSLTIDEWESCLVSAGLAVGEECRLSWHVNSSLVAMEDFKTQFTANDLVSDLTKTLSGEQLDLTGAISDAPWAIAAQGGFQRVRNPGGAQTSPIITMTNPVIVSCSLAPDTYVVATDTFNEQTGEFPFPFSEFSLKPGATNDSLAFASYFVHTRGSRSTNRYTRAALANERFSFPPSPLEFGTGIWFDGSTTPLMPGRPSGELVTGAFAGAGLDQLYLIGNTGGGSASPVVSLNGNQLIGRLAPDGKGGNAGWSSERNFLALGLGVTEAQLAAEGELARPFIWNDEGDTAPHPCKGPEVKARTGWIASDLFNPLP